MTLDELGPRLCIMGPSNSGKSTLAEAIARARGLTPVHLDQLHHRPHTAWQPRPAAEFAALHDAALAGERWVIDGNYSRLLPQRLARATGLILLDVPMPLGLLRYLRRSWLERDRPGGLEGAPERVTWAMIRHIALVQPGNRRRYAALFDALALPRISLPTPRALARFYAAERLTRRPAASAPAVERR